MYNTDYDPWMNAKNLATPAYALGEWNKAATEWYQRLAQQNLDLIGEHCSRKSEQLRRLTGIRKLEDLLHLQKEYLNEDVRAMIECTQKCIHASVENAENLTKLYESAMMRGNIGNFTERKSSGRERSGQRE